MIDPPERNLTPVEEDKGSRGPKSWEADSQTDVLALLERISSSWSKRASVKKQDVDLSLLFDPSKPDFLQRLLPFATHPLYQNAPDDAKQLALSCGWLAYNEKTIAIETEVITPACIHVVAGRVPGVSSQICRETISQVFVDEAYHTLMLVNACEITRKMRRLEYLRIPDPALVSKMNECKESQSENWKRLLIQIGCATISEVSISDYLSLLSTDVTVQPLNRLITDTHRRDELAHASVFKTVAKLMLPCLTPSESRFFVGMLLESRAWFANLELDVWRSMLHQVQFPNGDTIIEDLQNQAEYDLSKINLTDLKDILERVGIEEKHMDGFADPSHMGKRG